MARRARQLPKGFIFLFKSREGKIEEEGRES